MFQPSTDVMTQIFQVLLLGAGAIVAVIVLGLGGSWVVVKCFEAWVKWYVGLVRKANIQYDNELTQEPYHTIVTAGGYDPKNPETYSQARAFAQEVLNDRKK